VRKLLLMVPHPPFRTFFQPVLFHQFSSEIAVPHRCKVRKVVRNCPPLYIGEKVIRTNRQMRCQTDLSQYRKY